MKKPISIIMALLVGLSVTGCADTGNASESSAKETVTEEKTAEKSVTGNNCIGTVESQVSFASDPKVPENLIGDSASVLKVKIGEKKETVFPEGLPYPLTKYSVEVTEVISGNPDKKEITEISLMGGDVSAEEFMKANPSEVTKFGMDKLSKDEARVKFISYKHDFDFDLTEGNEYIVILNDKNTVLLNGYGIFEKKGTAYLNVLTDKELPKI